jgi:hypothetical protein
MCDNAYANSGRMDAQSRYINQLKKELANEQAKEATGD